MRLRELFRIERDRERAGGVKVQPARDWMRANWLRWLGNVELDSITNDDILELRRHWTGKTPDTVRRRIYFLRAALVRAEDRGDLREVPRLRAPRERGPLFEAKVIERPAFAALLAWLDRMPERWPRDIVEFARISSRRRGDLLQFRWEHLNEDRSLWTIPRIINKSRRPLAMPIGGKMKEIIERRWLLATTDRYWRKTPWVFFHDTKVHGWGRRITPEQLRWVWVRARQVGKVAKARFHDLRHTAVTNMILAGATVPQVMAVSGHVCLSSLQRYVHLERANVAVDVLAKTEAWYDRQDAAAAKLSWQPANGNGGLERVTEDLGLGGRSGEAPDRAVGGS